jgi:hypothetical protein
MKPFWKRLLLVLIAVVLVVGVIAAFTVGRKEAAREAVREKPIQAPTRVEVVNGEKVVTLDAAARTHSGVAVAPLEILRHRREIPAYGVVVDLQELSDLRNAIETAQAQLSKGNAAREVADKDYERVRALYKKNQNVSEKTVQAAQGTARVEAANVQAAQAAVHAAQATVRQRWGRTIADWLTQGASEFEQLRRQEHLLLQVTLAPGQTNAIAPAAASVRNVEGRLFAATFVSEAPRTDPKIQGRSFFYIVPAADANLLPGMNVTALLPVGEPVQAVAVPTAAVVWLQGKAWAYAQQKPDRFVRREVSTEQPVPGGWLQPKEFSTGELFVIQGPQVLLSEEFRAQISGGD